MEVDMMVNLRMSFNPFPQELNRRRNDLGHRYNRHANSHALRVRLTQFHALALTTANLTH